MITRANRKEYLKLRWAAIAEEPAARKRSRRNATKAAYAGIIRGKSQLRA